MSSTVAALPAKRFFYTNAEGPAGSGFRWLDPRGRSASPPARLRRWVAGLQISEEPELGVEAATATLAERPDRTLEVWMARAVRDFAEDAMGRPGGLVQVITVDVDEGRDRSLHAMALLRQARRWPLPAAGPRRLDRLLEQPWGRDSLEPEPIRLTALQVLGPGNLGRFVRASELLLSGTSHPPEVSIELPAGRTLEESAAALAGALPPRLRLATSWCCGLQDRGPSVRVRAAGEAPAEAPPAILGSSTSYVAWLAERLNGGDEAEILEVLCDWRLRSWAELYRRCGI